MKIRLSQRAEQDYRDLPEREKKDFKKQIQFLMQDLRHPSLRAKRYDIKGDHALWQARVNQRYRFYFHIEDDVVSILMIKDHPK